MRLASPFMPMWRELVAMHYLWERPHRLDDSALAALIGPVRYTPLQQAVTATLANAGALKNAPRAAAP
jgi:hypothetical protein